VKGDGRRAQRVATLLRSYLTEALTREIADPRLLSLVVTSVTVPDDLAVARIGVRLLSGDEDPEQRRSALRAVRRAASRLRRGVGPRLGLRRVPELQFFYDTGHDASRRVEELLQEIAKERGEH
jgi:ribosome-binding factor A